MLFKIGLAAAHACSSAKKGRKASTTTSPLYEHVLPRSDIHQENHSFDLLRRLAQELIHVGFRLAD